MKELLAFFDANQQTLLRAARAGHSAKALTIAEDLWKAFLRLKAPHRLQPLIPLAPIQARVDNLAAMHHRPPQKAKAAQVERHLAQTRAGIEGALSEET